MFLLFFLSGATGLVYQVLWLRRLVLVFGSTLHATSAILAVFMGGLALGAWAGGRWMDRRPTASALVVYGVLEIGVGCVALLVPWLLDGLAPLLSTLAGAGASSATLNAAKVCGIAVVLLPPTILMGATLPVLARRAAGGSPQVGGRVGALYAVNTFGAVAGTFVAAFIALPAIGNHATATITAAANLTLGVVAFVLARRDPRTPPPVPIANAVPGSEVRPWNRRMAIAVFAASGLAAMALEVTWTRGLALVFGSSVYAFASMLVAFLVGLAAGGAIVSAWLSSRRAPDAVGLLAGLLATAGAGALGSAFVLNALPEIMGRLLLDGLTRPEAVFTAQFAIALALMLPTTIALGGVFPAVLQAYAGGARTVSGPVGRAYAANTAGAIAGALGAGFIFVPKLGIPATLGWIAALQLGLAAATAASIPSFSRGRRTALAVALGVSALAFPGIRPSWDVLLMNAGVYFNLPDAKAGISWDEYAAGLKESTRVIFAAEGVSSSVLVADHLPSGSRYIAINGKVDASTKADLETQVVVGHLPLLLHPRPERVLIVGLGSGISTSAVAAHPVTSISVLEVEKEMIPAARFFGSANNDVLDDPRVSVTIRDARDALRLDEQRYDVIVSQPSNPWMTVASNLFTREFFAEARTRLEPGGVFCQWVQMYCLRPDDLRSVLAAFRESFPNVLVFGTLGGVDLVLIGTDEPVRFDRAALARRMAELRVRMSLARVGIREPVDLLALLRVGDREIDGLLKGAPMNTDDNGRVEFSAPKSLYLETIDANTRVLLGSASDPSDYLAGPPLPPEEIDELRLEISRRRLARGEAEWAAAARFALPGAQPADARATDEFIDIR